MTPERGNCPPRWWRGQKERYSLMGTEIELSNPGKVVVFQGRPFHLSNDGRLTAFTDEEWRKFILNQKA